MKLTIDVPDRLGNSLNNYLKEHPEETLFGLVKEVLEIKLMSNPHSAAQSRKKDSSFVLLFSPQVYC
jgi:hypothetical protein